MARQAIKQAHCVECGDEEATFKVTDKSVDVSEGIVTYEVRCTCRATGRIEVDELGVTSQGAATHETASWVSDESSEERQA